MKQPWPQVKLGDVLTRVKDAVAINDDQSYARLTIRMNGKGIVQRDRVSGCDIGTKKQFIAYAGQLVLSKIDARNGAFGILPEDCDRAIITGNFWAFDANKEQLLPAYFDYLTKTPMFVEFCVRSSEGTTNRLYLQEPTFLAQTIPLPPLAEQRRIVARIEELAAQIQEAQSLRQQAAEQAEALVVRSAAAIFDSIGNRVRLGDICDTSSGGTPSRDRADFFAGDIPWIKSGELKDDYIDKVEEHITEQAVQSSSAKLFPSGTVLVALYGANVGKTGILSIEATTNQAVCAIFPTKVIDRDFIWWFLRRMRPVFVEDSFGGAQPNISQKIIRDTKIPAPSLTEQRRIVAELDALQAEVDRLKALQAETAAELAALLPSLLDRAFKGEL